MAKLPTHKAENKKTFIFTLHNPSLILINNYFLRTFQRLPHIQHNTNPKIMLPTTIHTCKIIRHECAHKISQPSCNSFRSITHQNIMKLDPELHLIQSKGCRNFTRLKMMQQKDVIIKRTWLPSITRCKSTT